MTTARSNAEGHVPFAVVAPRPSCERCGSYLRQGRGQDQGAPHTLCDPCAALVASCVPFAGIQPVEAPATLAGPAPADVNLLELVAGIMLLHDALHPGKVLALREALASYGVNVDHVTIWQVVGKLGRRHGLMMSGESRVTGYRVNEWKWEARRTKDTLERWRLSHVHTRPAG